MLERFTTEARAAVVGAQQEARQLHHDRIGTEHLLLALVAQDTPSAVVLGRHGLTHDSVVESVASHAATGGLDAEALDAVGIDLDAVRRSTEAAFGAGALDRPWSGGRPRGHIPFSPRAKKVLELSLREAIASRSRRITDGHIALGLLGAGPGGAAEVLTERGVDADALRRDLTRALMA